MNMKLLCDRLIEDETLKDIPLTVIFRVAFSIFEIINSGECFFQNDED